MLTNERTISLAVYQDGTFLCYASDRLKDSEEFISLVLKQTGYCLPSLSDRLKKKRRMICLCFMSKYKPNPMSKYCDYRLTLTNLL